MAKSLTPAQISALAIKAGFKASNADIITAIVMAESGGNPSKIGDINNPGPGASSTGLSQINYLPSRDAGNTTRDTKANLDPLTNLKNAYKISKSGTNFSAWTTYTTSDPAKKLQTISTWRADSGN